jgi:hypothetical protein
MPPDAPDGPAGEELLSAPWTAEQVYRLNRRQDAAAPYTCRWHRDVPMFATRAGWVCSTTVSRGRPCPYRQAWARRADADALVGPGPRPLGSPALGG